MKSKLKWLCRRGTKELDLIVTNYLENQYDNDSEARREAFCKLLQYQDPIILDLLFDNLKDNDPHVQEIIAYMQNMRVRGNW